MNPALLPLDLPGGRPGWEGGHAAAPFLGTFVILLLLAALVAGLVYLHRTGRLAGLGGVVRPSPEAEAKRILADRFARGDITAEDFMERASILNWTPGSEPYRPQKRRRVQG